MFFNHSSIPTDYKYLNLISSRLRNFKWKKPGKVANCSCPICGDSSTNDRKARGFFFIKDSTFLYKCFNCGVVKSFDRFLSDFDVIQHKSYILEKLRFKRDPVKQKDTRKEVKEFNRDYLSGLVALTNLATYHPTKKYVLDRKIPLKHQRILFHCDDFKKYVNEHDPETGMNLVSEPRLVIPFYDENGKIFAVQGRAIGPSALRYITIKFDDRPKIYGLERVDKSRAIIVVEGPIDSLFLDNAIAIAGSDISEIPNLPKDKLIFMFDNEPRNKEIVKKIESMIDKGYNVFLVPEKLKKFGKDINDMILHGFDVHELQCMITREQKSGLAAKLEIMHWKHVNIKDQAFARFSS